MKARVLQDEAGRRVLAVVFDKGDEVVSGLTRLAEEYRITAGHVTGIGALSRVELGFFNRHTRTYDPLPTDGHVELLALTGNVTLNEGRPKVHLHAVVGMPDGSARGGHLLEATVWPTLEAFLTVLPAVIERRMDEETGLALIDL